MVCLLLQWQPRRASSGSNPRPIHEIRQEAYIEHNSSHAGRVATKHPPPLGVTSYSQSQISESIAALVACAWYDILAHTYMYMYVYVYVNRVITLRSTCNVHYTTLQQ